MAFSTGDFFGKNTIFRHTSKLLKASQEKGCEKLKDWMRGARNHLYWCVTSTLQGFGDLILAKWKSFMRHVNNKHKDHPDALFTECAHEDIAPRKCSWEHFVCFQRPSKVPCKILLGVILQMNQLLWSPLLRKRHLPAENATNL